MASSFHWLLERWRSLNLAQKFNIICLLILLMSMLALGWWVGRSIRVSVINRTAATTSLYVENFIIQQLQELGDNEWLSDVRISEIERLLATTPLGEEIVDIKIWGPDGHLVYGEGAGKTFPIKEELSEAWQGKVSSHISNLSDAENEAQREQYKRLIETYTPMRIEGSDQIIAVAEFYQLTNALDQEIFAAQWRSWLLVAGIILLMYLLLVGLVRRGSDTIEQQQKKLQDQVNNLNLLLEQNSELRQRVQRAATRNTTVNERFLRRIGSDLHDGPAQDVSLSVLKLYGLTHHLPENQAFHKDLETVQGSLNNALQEMRTIAAGLRLPELNHLSLAEAIQKAVKENEKKTGVKVSLELSTLSEDIALPVKITVYRIIQEALNNAYTHGEGQDSKVSVQQYKENLHLEISDTGPGFDVKSLSKRTERLGIASMRERVESLGGVFSIISRIGSGTIVIAHLPINPDREIVSTW